MLWRYMKHRAAISHSYLLGAAYSPYDDRNTRKCNSAQGLWALQEPLQRVRWLSEAGKEAWSNFEGNCRHVDSPAAVLRNTPIPETGAREMGDELRELVWNGVPADMREEVYMSLSGQRVQ